MAEQTTQCLEFQSRATGCQRKARCFPCGLIALCGRACGHAPMSDPLARRKSECSVYPDFGFQVAGSKPRGAKADFCCSGFQQTVVPVNGTSRHSAEASRGRGIYSIAPLGDHP